jgi:broad specificity phosphatase PhoE
MLPRSFLFVRHGETDWNRAEKLQGLTDIPLNDTGRAQARAAIEWLRRHPVDRIVASTLARARETAEIINETLQKPISFCDGLRERSFGVMEGRRYHEMEALRAQLAAAGAPLEESGFPCVPEAEPYADFKARIFASIDRELSFNNNEQVMFVCHGGVYRVLRKALLGDLAQSPNVRPFMFRRAVDSWHILDLQEMPAPESKTA